MLIDISLINFDKIRRKQVANFVIHQRVNCFPVGK